MLNSIGRFFIGLSVKVHCLGRVEGGKGEAPLFWKLGMLKLRIKKFFYKFNKK